MGIFKKIEESLFTGKIIKDYGIIDKRKEGIVEYKHNMFLTQKKNKKKIIIRETVKSPFGFNVRYIELEREGVQKLKDALENALEVMR